MTVHPETIAIREITAKFTIVRISSSSTLIADFGTNIISAAYLVPGNPFVIEPISAGPRKNLREDVFVFESCLIRKSWHPFCNDLRTAQMPDQGKRATN